MACAVFCRGWLVALAAGCLQAELPQAARDEVLRHMERDASRYSKLSRQIWELAEVGFHEEKSSALLRGELQREGFRIESGVAGMPSAFTASWGQGKPVIAIMGEYDALPGLSQEAVPVRKPRAEGQPGHGCGHNLFGVAAAHAAIAVKNTMKAQGTKGTVRFYGTPAEEGGGGKIFMIRAGLFKDVDAAITWHPWDATMATAQNWLATVHARFRFTGTPSHAAAGPEQGRSALDAAMIMTHAVDLMREHVPQETRMHYILPKTGTAVNIVPDFTEVDIMVRHPDATVLAGIWERTINCAKAGALATGTEVAHEVVGSYANMVANRAMTSAIDRNLRHIGGYQYTAEEQAFAEAVRKTWSSEPARPLGEQAKVLPIIEGVLSGSTDVGDVSYTVPTAQLLAATWVPGTPAHTGQSTAASGMTIGQKGMMVAAKALALTALDLLNDGKLLDAAKTEFASALKGKSYQSLHPALPK